MTKNGEYMNNEKLLKQLDKNDQWIQNADVKLSIILTFIGVLGGFILSQKNKNLLFKSNEEFIHYFIAIAFILAISCLIIGFYCSAKGVTAKIKNSKRGLWFFGDVSAYEEAHFFKRAKEKETEEDFQGDIVNQIYITAKIAMYKFKCLNRSIFWVKTSVFLFVFYFILKMF
jgi:hypothetical protein